MACVLACAAWALCMQGAEAETATWIASQKGTENWETAANWEAGVVPAITNSLDLSATNLVVTLAGDPQGLQVIDNPWTQETGGDKVVLALNALVGGPKTEFDIWYANFCRPLLIRDPSRYLGAWAIPSAVSGPPLPEAIRRRNMGVCPRKRWRLWVPAPCAGRCRREIWSEALSWPDRSPPWCGRSSLRRRLSGTW